MLASFFSLPLYLACFFTGGGIQHAYGNLYNNITWIAWSQCCWEESDERNPPVLGCVKTTSVVSHWPQDLKLHYQSSTTSCVLNFFRYVSLGIRLNPYNNEWHLSHECAWSTIGIVYNKNSSYLNVLAVFIRHHHFNDEVLHIRWDGLLADLFHEFAKLQRQSFLALRWQKNETRMHTSSKTKNPPSSYQQTNSTAYWLPGWPCSHRVSRSFGTSLRFPSEWDHSWTQSDPRASTRWYRTCSSSR